MTVFLEWSEWNSRLAAFSGIKVSYICGIKGIKKIGKRICNLSFFKIKDTLAVQVSDSFLVIMLYLFAKWSCSTSIQLGSYTARCKGEKALGFQHMKPAIYLCILMLHLPAAFGGKGWICSHSCVISQEQW